LRRTFVALAAGMSALLALLPACSSSLTGGSIPPGSTLARASGIVIRGDNAAEIVSGASIRFQPVTAGSRQIGIGGGGTLEPPSPPDLGGGGGGGVITPPVTEVPGTVLATSNVLGEFNATGLPNGPVRVIVTPPADTGLATIVYNLQISAGDVYYLVSAPPRAGLSTAGLTGIDVSPDAIALVQGRNVQIEVRLQGGAPPAMVPNYLVKGEMGIVNRVGQFTAVQPGNGFIRVVVGPFVTPFR